VHRQQASGPFGDRRLHLVDPHEVRVLVHVDEHRRGADRVDRDHCGRGGIRHRDHLVARPDADRLQAKHNRVRAVVDTHAVRDPVVVGELTLEPRDAWPEHELARAEDLVDRGEDLVALGFVLVQITPDILNHGRRHPPVRLASEFNMCERSQWSINYDSATAESY
jgi:hypothetical protein